MFAKTLLPALVLASHAAALEPIVIKGSKFFYENGTQFFIKGIAYQQDTSAGGGGVTGQTFKDPLANPAACRRDVPLLQELGTNTIRTYAIDPTADHTVCMGLLEDAGIYVISDLGEPTLSIETDNPQWDINISKRYRDVVDELSKYDNVIGFFAGNEVTTNKTNTPASAYVKAAVRDTKAYLAEQGKKLYVGYAANDDPDVRRDIAHYFNCGDDQKDAIDFWGYNIYQWCGDSSLQKSGWDKQVQFFSNYSVPVFFAEYGCNEGKDGAEGRIFTDTTALYKKPMTDVFSGGIVYMYFQEANDYGLVELDGNAAKRMKNFKKLADSISKVDPDLLEISEYTTDLTPQQCPPLSTTWEVAGDLPPTPDETVCECMVEALTCVPVPGLDPKQYGAIFDFICDAGGEDVHYCEGINGNTTTGGYGAFSMCNAEQKLGHVLDRYYRSLNFASDACDFRGQATSVDAKETSDECKSKLDAAKEKAGGANGSGSSADDEKDAAGRLGGFGVGAYIVGAVLVGGMFL
ncbi:related to beta (1-3) glucanosyltransferase gel3p [Cephalotrichum gorgonifer]|uniref:1,3-beta-glucanosyltransferase n=1 Tax=Cephalotrichum gorgonifer TaxID=2041049 RepID=A0AAE8MS54_9PEZI|nr:related to beta (1-3) glucanosyltransferase gel3p [Cephalotrichum gorgonifer]